MVKPAYWHWADTRHGQTEDVAKWGYKKAGGHSVLQKWTETASQQLLTTLIF